MKLPLSWLRTFVKTNKSAEEIAGRLTMAGLEVEEIESAHSFSGVVVGKVISLEKHPNADKLRVARVQVSPPGVIPANAGIQKEIAASQTPRNDDGILQIVCGAANLAVGQLVPVAIVGAKIGDFEISKASLRGVDSYGMICSEKELGLGADHSGIMILEKGQKIGEVFVSDKNTEQVLDVKVLANRPDCMSIIGLANEVAATLDTKINIPAIKLKESLPNEKIKIKIDNKELCPRYMTRVVKNVKRSETPEWMKERLVACGVRPIDLLVDISNYVMLEYGQPLHFFDFDKLKITNNKKQKTNKTESLNLNVTLSGTKGPGLDSPPCSEAGSAKPQNDRGGVEIVVRSAREGEVLVTLDGNKRKLSPENLVIANSKEAIALAGVMGGLTTEIGPDTKNILIEAAIFEKSSIRKTSRSLGLRSEAVARFEKGISLMLPEVAINRAAELLSNLTGGEVCKGVTDTLTEKIVPTKLGINPSKLNAFLGTNYTNTEIKNTLNKLGFIVTEKTKYNLEILVPFWRVDILESVDIYEEVVRLIGYDTVPNTLPYDVHTMPEENKSYALSTKVRSQLSGFGYDEIMTYSFIGSREITSIGENVDSAAELQNPLVKEQQYLRTTLVPQMLESLASNQFIKDSVQFFEVGKSFVKTAGKKLPTETTWLTLGSIGGSSTPLKYSDGRDYYELKGALIGLLESLGFSGLSIKFEKLTKPYLITGQSAKIFLDKLDIGEIGMIAASTEKAFGLKKKAAVALLNLDILLSNFPEIRKFSEISKYPKSTRDLSILIDKQVDAATIIETLQQSGSLVQSAAIIDIFEGKTLEADKKSVTVRLEIYSYDKTLTDEEVDKVVEKSLDNIVKVGGTIRGGK